jgi:hypothetical protein
MRACGAFLVALAGASSLLAADDVLSLAPLIYGAAGRVARVPVYVLDKSGSPVGNDVNAQIRNLHFTVTFTHPEWIVGCTSEPAPTCQVFFTPAGVLARKAWNQAERFDTGSSVFIRRVTANGSTVTWSLDGVPPGDLIGYLEIELTADAATGGEIVLEFDPASDATALADRGATVVESSGNGLQLKGGILRVADCSGPPLAEEYSMHWLGGIGGCTETTGSCRSGETIFFDIESTRPSFDACETITWDFGDGRSTADGSEAFRRFEDGPYMVSSTIERGGQTLTLQRELVVVHLCDLPPDSEFHDVRVSGPVSLCDGNYHPCGTGEIVDFKVKFDRDLEACAALTWDFGDGSTPVTGMNATHAYAAPGDYTIVVTVVTPGGTTKEVRTVKVRPFIQCEAFVPLVAIIDRPVSFHSTSNVTGGETYLAWAFGDFDSALGADTEHTYRAYGTYTWYLVVEHPDYALCRRSGNVTVTPPPRRRAVGHSQ